MRHRRILRRMTVHFAACALTLVAAGELRAQRELREVPPPDIEQELAAFEVAEGFEVSLFAADPLLNKPIQMNFDAAGRLWVASSSLYPHLAPGDVPEDRVLILEDGDGDGRADSSTVFAEGLLMPTAVEPGDGGAYVANSTELVHLADTDGDGRADRRRVVLSGFGTEDTHHIIHTFRWGHDGFLYFNQSIYIHSHVETPHGVRRLDAGGIWQFRPATLELNVFVRGMVNGWGHAFDPWGQHFGTDGAYSEGILYFVPGASYFTAKNDEPKLQGLHRGTPKYCGLEIIDGEHLPEDWRGSMITNDFRAHRVVRYVIGEDGAGYAATLMPDVLRSSHVAFRPIDVKQGPDGAIYIADWYNPIIQHGEVSFRDERRNHVNGRIWRVTAKARPLTTRPQLVGASIGALLDELKSSRPWNRHFAKRVLAERPAAVVVTELERWIDALDASDPAFEHHLLEALWTRQTIRQPDGALVERVLRASDGRVRAAAVRALGHWLDAVPDGLSLLAALVMDDVPRVRLEAVRSLGRVRDPRAVELALGVLDRPMDGFLEYGLTTTVRDLRDVWLPALAGGTIDFGGNARQLSFALAAAGSPDVVGPIVGLLRARDVPLERRVSLLGVVAAVGKPADLALVFESALALAAEPSARTAAVEVLERLADAWAARGLAAPEDSARALALLHSDDPQLAASGCRLAGLWGVSGAVAPLRALAASRDSAVPLCRASLDALSVLASADARAALETLADDPRAPASLRHDAVAALAAVDPDAAAPRAVALLVGEPDPDSIDRLLRAFVRRQGGAGALASALAGKKVGQDIARIGLREARTTALVDASLVAALEAAGGFGGDAPSHSRSALLAAFAAEHAPGDPRRGEAVFRRESLRCQSCHAIGGSGGLIGPELSSLGASAPFDYVLDSLLEPDKAIKEGFHSLAIVTTRGEVHTGIKTRETAEAITLHDAEGNDVTIPRSRIVAETPGRSLMPSGLLDGLAAGEAIDLLRFLSELGRSPDFSVGRARFARSWRFLAGGLGRLAVLSPVEQARALADGRGFEWVPAYSRVDGRLPLVAGRGPSAGRGPDAGRGPSAAERTPRGDFAHALLEVTTPGAVGLELESGVAVELYVDGRASELDRAGRSEVELERGEHVVLVRFETPSAGAELRLALFDAGGSPARARFVGGR